MTSKIAADAWVLHKGNENQEPGALVREPFEIDSIGDDQVLVEPLYGCWEANMSHAIERKPVDIARQRKEDKVVIGNAGVVRILEKGKNVNTCKEGDVCIVFCVGIIDKRGYPIRIMAYDAPNTMGVLSKVAKMPGHSVIPIPENSRYSLPQWAAFSLRYVTAWSNWKMAFETWKIQAGNFNPAEEYVLGWGGGVSYATALLAKHAGFNSILIASNDERLQAIEDEGLIPLDRRLFADMQFNPAKYKSDEEYRNKYLHAENIFVEKVNTITKGEDVAILCDYIGLPVYRASLKVLGRGGVITTAGWKDGMVLTTYRAIECISRHTHVHTHYANYAEGLEAVAYAEEHGWLPEVDENEIYAFDDVPQLVEDYNDGTVKSYFPIFKIN